MNVNKGFIVKRILMMSCFLMILSSCAKSSGSKFDFTSGTPLFKSPAINSEILAVTTTDITMDVVEGKLVYLERNPAVDRQWHPLMVYAYFYKVNLPDGRSAWASDDLQYDTVNKMILPKTVPQLIWAAPFMISISLLLILIYYAYSAGYLSLITKGTGFNEAKPAIMFVLIFLFLTLLLVVFYSGSSYLLFSILLFHLAVSVSSWCADVRQKISAPEPRSRP